MNKTDSKNVLEAAKVIMSIYMEVKKLNTDNEFYNTIAKQGYIDSLEAMRRNNLIADYCLFTGNIKPVEKS
jgi:hypothetical protein